MQQCLKIFFDNVFYELWVYGKIKIKIKYLDRNYEIMIMIRILDRNYDNIFYMIYTDLYELWNLVRG